MKIGSLFSGYGGLDLGVMAVLGGEVAWHVEFDPAPSKILAHHWSAVPNYGDVTAVDWATVEPVDILTGGYPCQPFSQAGKRKGTNDDRHLWPYVRESIRALRPRYTILENVAGHRSLGFDRVLGDLAEDGLHARWVSVRASDVGAPHHRERIFILVEDPAYGSGAERGGPKQNHLASAGWSAAEHRERAGAHTVRRRSTTDTDCRERAGHERAPRRQTIQRETTAGDRPGLPAGPEGERRLRQQQSGRSEAPRSSTDVRKSPLPDYGEYGPAVRRWERILGIPAPAPTDLNSNGRPRLNAKFAEWMMGLPAGHVTNVPGISRADQLKAIGNGVCPQQAAAALTQLLEMETPP